jgi:hypothetical protein
VISITAVGTAVAALVVSEDKEVAEVAAPVARVQNASTKPGAVPSEPISTQLPTRAPIGRQRGDPFAARSWAPPPPPQQEQLQVEAPRIPPNPYRFAGTVHHNGQRQVYLLLGNRLVEAKEGEMLEQGYRVKSVTDNAVTLVYEQIPDHPVTVAFTEPAPAAAGGASAAPSVPPLAPR